MTDPTPRSPTPLPPWLHRLFPPGMRRALHDVGGAAMHVMEWGPPDGQPVLLLHGNPSWGLLYRKVVAALADTRLRLVVPDLVGLGCSDKPRDAAAHTLDAHGAWLGALVDRLGLDDVVLAVQDWGGPIGLRAFAARPARLAGLVVMNTVVGPPRPGFRPTAFHRFARLPVVSDAVFRLGFPQNAMAAAQGDRLGLLGRPALGYWWPLRRFADRVAPLALARMVPDSPAHPSIPALERCQEAFLRFDGPLAIVWGDRDPVLGRVLPHLQRLAPRAEVTRTAGGHFLQEEVPAEIAAAIRGVAARSAGGRSRA